MFEECKLYGVKRKKLLKYLIGTEHKNIKELVNNYKVFIIDGVRLVETPRANLKKVHVKIKRYFSKIEYPQWLMSQKGFSYVDNASYHASNRFILALDIKGFFPNSNREFVYKFYRDKLEMSNDVASLMSDLTTINYSTYRFENKDIEKNIDSFFKKKDIKCFNHIPTGSPISTALSYLAFQDMFEEINLLLDNDMRMSLYVDDLAISSRFKISKKLIIEIQDILFRYSHRLSNKKTKLYDKNKTKQITGVIITPYSETKVPNKLNKKIHDNFTKYIAGEFDSLEQKDKLREKIYGCVLSARQIVPNSFSYIHGKVKKRLVKIN